MFSRAVSGSWPGLLEAWLRRGGGSGFGVGSWVGFARSITDGKEAKKALVYVRVGARGVV